MFVVDKSKYSSSIAFVCHYLVYNPCDVQKKLKCGNNDRMCFANLVAPSLVSCIERIAKGVCEYAIGFRVVKRTKKLIQ